MCGSVVTTSTRLQIIIALSCLITFVGCSVSGLLLILAPEEPSLKLGGGAEYALIPGAVMCTLAVCVVIGSIVGCLSVSNDSKIGLCCYSIIGFIIVFAAVACGSALFSFAYSGTISNKLNDTLWKDLRSDSGGNDTVFKIQAKYHCCGVNHYDDWLNNTNEKQYPSSCCPDNSFGNSCNEQQVYKKGCREVLLRRLRIVVDASFGAAVLGAVVQAIASTLACYGITLIKKYQIYDIL